MYFLLYALLSLNLLMGYISYQQGDQLGVRHAVTFFCVTLVALGLVWLTKREDGTRE